MIDNSDMELIAERNGFEIRRNPDTLKYRVHLPQYERSYISDFGTLFDAESFCNANDADKWEGVSSTNHREETKTMSSENTCSSSEAPNPNYQPPCELRQRFEAQVMQADPSTLQLVAVAVQHPSGAVELIANHTHLDDKIDWYLRQYDRDFRLKHSPGVRIVDFMIV